VADDTDGASINCTIEMTEKGDIRVDEVVDILVKLENNGNAILDMVGVFFHLPNGMRYESDNMNAEYEDESNYRSLLWENIGPLNPKDNKIIDIKVAIDGSELGVDLVNEVFVIGKNENDNVEYYYKLILRHEIRTTWLAKKEHIYRVGLQTSEGAFTINNNGIDHPVDMINMMHIRRWG
jgi:hypothetical protein